MSFVLFLPAVNVFLCVCVLSAVCRKEAVQAGLHQLYDDEELARKAFSHY